MSEMKPLSALDPAEVSTVASKTFLNIIDAWGLSQTEAMKLLGYDDTTRSTYFKWKKEPASVKLQKEKLERLSYVFGIYKALQVLLPNSSSADAWIKKPNTAPIFNGESALSRMLSGNVADLYVVRHYLDSERGW